MSEGEQECFLSPPLPNVTSTLPNQNWFHCVDAGNLGAGEMQLTTTNNRDDTLSVTLAGRPGVELPAYPYCRKPKLQAG